MLIDLRGFATGLTGSVTYRLVNADKTEYAAATTTGITEVNGAYCVTVADATLAGRKVEWHDGAGNYGSESFPVGLASVAQTGDAYAIVNNGTYGNSHLAKPGDSMVASNMVAAPDNTNITNIHNIVKSGGTGDAAAIMAVTNKSAFDQPGGGANPYYVKSSKTAVLGTVLTESGTGRLAAGEKKFFDVATPANTLNDLATGAAQTTILGKLLGYVQALTRKDAGPAAFVTEINATVGGTAGTFDQTTDSPQALRDRGDSAWTTASGFMPSTAKPTVGGYDTGMDPETRLLVTPANKLATDSSGNVTLTTLCITAVRDAINSLATYGLTALKALLDGIKGKTDNIPASPAAVGSAMTLTSAYDAAKSAASATALGNVQTHGDSTWATAVGFSTLTARQVWEYGTRGLTTFGTLVADIASAAATAVWGAAARTITGGTVQATNINGVTIGVQQFWDPKAKMMFLNRGDDYYVADGRGIPVTVTTQLNLDDATWKLKLTQMTLDDGQAVATDTGYVVTFEASRSKTSLLTEKHQEMELEATLGDEHVESFPGGSVYVRPDMPTVA